MMHCQGFTLIEVALAVTIGLAITAASMYGYQQVQKSAKFSQSKSIVGTIQTNIGMDKFRLGVPPSPGLITTNTDSAARPYFPGDVPGQLPREPVTGINTMLPYSSAASPVPLASGAPTAQWDNPVFSSPGPSPGYGNGGWLYDSTTGAFRANLSNEAYPDQRPASW